MDRLRTLRVSDVQPSQVARLLRTGIDIESEAIAAFSSGDPTVGLCSTVNPQGEDGEGPSLLALLKRNPEKIGPIVTLLAELLDKDRTRDGRSGG